MARVNRSELTFAPEYVSLGEIQLHAASAEGPVGNEVVNDGPNRICALAPKAFDSEQARDCRRRSFFDQAELVFDEIQHS